jgi:hypothetical protein
MPFSVLATTVEELLMAFDVYPDPPAAPLSLAKGVPSGLIPFIERAAIDPATGRNTMYLALIKLGSGCAAPGPPDPMVGLRVDSGPLTEIGTQTALFGQPDADQPAAIASLTHTSSPDLYLVDIEVLQSGRSWNLQIRHSGPADTHGFTWVVADSKAQTRQPWIDVPASVEWQVFTGQVQTRSLQVLNRGTGRLEITDGDGAGLGDGFVLTAVQPRLVDPNSCAQATISFTAPDTPSASASVYLVSSNDARAQSTVGHNQRVNLKATTRRKPLVEPGDILIVDENPGGRFRGVIGVDPRTGAQTLVSSGNLFRRPQGVAVEAARNILSPAQ